MTDLTVIEARLQNGWELIDKTTDPAQKQRLIDHWLTLEQQYRAAADEINYANPEQHAFTWRTSA